MTNCKILLFVPFSFTTFVYHFRVPLSFTTFFYHFRLPFSFLANDYIFTQEFVDLGLDHFIIPSVNRQDSCFYISVSYSVTLGRITLLLGVTGLSFRILHSRCFTVFSSHNSNILCTLLCV